VHQYTEAKPGKTQNSRDKSAKKKLLNLKKKSFGEMERIAPLIG
jgi:endonuclease III-like uncharacterized protein